LLEGVVPRLGGPSEMVRRQPGSIRGRSVLASEELLTLVDRIERVDGAIVCRKIELVEAGCLGPEAWSLSWRRWRSVVRHGPLKLSPATLDRAVGSKAVDASEVDAGAVRLVKRRWQRHTGRS
jgi:hypothetical protein